MFREISIRWSGSFYILTVMVGNKVSFHLTMILRLSDNSGRAAHGEDLQSGVGSEAERDLPSETERSATQQRRASIPATCQSGCTQRLVLLGSKSLKIEKVVIIFSLQAAGRADQRHHLAWLIHHLTTLPGSRGILNTSEEPFICLWSVVMESFERKHNILENFCLHSTIHQWKTQTLFQQHLFYIRILGCNPDDV